MAGLQGLSNIKMNDQPRTTRHSRKTNPLRQNEQNNINNNYTKEQLNRGMRVNKANTVYNTLKVI